MEGLYTNSNSRGDFMRPVLEQAAGEAREVFIASAFFTDREFIEKLASKDCTIRMVVRLDFPTCPFALQAVMRSPSLQIRYYTSSAFHPKLYIFDNRIAFVGSANLTNAALMANQEVVVAVGADDPRFTELAVLFSEYWTHARPLVSTVLDEYRTLYKKFASAQRAAAAMSDDVKSKLGDNAFPNIGRDQQPLSAENVFLDSYRKTYQDCVAAFHHIARAYSATGRRKVPEDAIPLRLEIDSFLSFVKDEFAKGDTWIDVPVGWNDDRRRQLDYCIREWHDTPWPHFEETIVLQNYPRLKRVFDTPNTLSAATDDELFEALTTIHSFHDRLRFFTGGLVGLREAFIGGNDASHIRRSLAHLVFGAGDPETRLADLIYMPAYKLNAFGQSGVQELMGWLNKADMPVINGRTTKVLRYFGFDVQQLSA